MKKKLFLFRPIDHYRRFINSCQIISMEFDHSPESLTDLTLTLLRKDGYQNIYIRLLAYKADEVIGVRLHGLKEDLTIFAMPFGHMSSMIRAPMSPFPHGGGWRTTRIPAHGKISRAYASSA